MKAARALRGHALRLAGLVLLCAAALQVVFALRIALMVTVDPQSTTFQRSEMRRLLVERHALAWSQQWVEMARISPQLQRAVIASEDASFAEHGGVDWDAIEQAWQKNQRAEQRAEKRAERRPPAARVAPAVKIVGGSTITQQLAKNLFLSGERTVLRKGQELVLTLLLEGTLSKRRILEIYLNNVEWGEGLFGAQAAARHYFHVDAARLGPEQAARLAVMLPAPKRFEKRPASPYVVGRAATMVLRMGAVELPR
jgi:monofunctional biosynthetic peptidoglycan transglycosylase